MLFKQFKFLFHYRTNKKLYRTLSWRGSGVSISHQFHHGWFWFAPLFLSRPPSPFDHPPHPIIARNNTKQPAKVPLPSHEGCGPVYKTLTHLGSEIVPLPFPKGCGSFIVVRRRFDGGFGEGKSPGGPIRCVWETNHKFVFRQLSSQPHPTDLSRLRRRPARIK